MGSKDIFDLEFSLHKADEKSDILFFKAGDVVGPVDDPLKDALPGQQPDHPAQLRSVLEVGVQLMLPRDLTETWHLIKIGDTSKQILLFTFADIFVTSSCFSQSLAFSQSSAMAPSSCSSLPLVPDFFLYPTSSCLSLSIPSLLLVPHFLQNCCSCEQVADWQLSSSTIAL